MIEQTNAAKCSQCLGLKGLVGDKWQRNQCTGGGGSFKRGWIPCHHCKGTGVEPSSLPQNCSKTE